MIDPALVSIVEAFIPIVAILSAIGAPVVIYLGNRYFKLKEKELALDAEARSWAEKHAATLESRVQRVESVLLSLDQGSRAHLVEGPATQGTGGAGPDPLKLR